MKLKRMMAIVLCFAMVLSTMSFSVFAEDATVTVSSYDELVAALTNAETETIELAGDITIDTSITVPDGVILDLKGNTLYVNVENSYYNNVTIKNGNIVLGKDDVHVCDGYFLVNEDKALVLSDVNMSSATDGIKGYAVFHLKTGANLDLIDSTLNISDNEYAAGYIVYAGESTATVDITRTTVTGTNVNGILHATTVIDNSTFTIGDANEHGINRSAVRINDSTVTISGGTGRGITAEHGDLVISGKSVVNISDMGEATIELRNDNNLTVADTATVTVDVAVNNTTSGTITGDVTVDGATEPPVVNANVKIGEKTYITLQDALADAKDGDTITLIWKEGNAPIAMNGYVSGKTVTITGTAEVDWEKGFLFVGRTTDDTEASDAKLIFENATLTTTAGGDHGIHVSGAEKGSATKANGTVEIKNSNINLTYLINKGAMSLDNSTLTVKSGFSIGGRPASETESGEDATATIDLKNGSKVVVDNHNGMGLGYEAIGIMNIDESSAFESIQNFLVTEKGTMNVNGGNVDVKGKLEVKGTLTSHGDIYGEITKASNDAVIEIYAGVYSYDPTAYVVNGLQVVYDDLTELYTVVGTMFTLAFDTNGGNTIGPLRDVQGGTVIELSSYVPTRSGYSFEGWFSDAELTQPITSIKLLANTTIYAKWSKISTGGGGGGAVAAKKYTLTFETNGGKTVNKITKAMNTIVDLSECTTEKDGYIFDGWYADKDFNNVVTSVKLTKNTTVYAKWTKEAETDKPGTEDKDLFVDVKTGDWFYENVKYVVKNKLMNGVSEDQFAPNDTLTRAMLVTILYRLESEPETDNVSFTDVKPEEYYANAVSWAKQKGIVNGITETEFAPNSNITREQIATIIHRYADFKGYDVSVSENTNIFSYDDAESISKYAVASMEYAVGSGLIQGKSATTLNPKDNATRAEIAAILQRFIEANKQ